MPRPVSFDNRRGGLYVDVGEKELFYVELDEAESYAMLYSSASSVLVRVRTTTGDDIVLRVAWSKYKRIAYGKGYIGMEVCAHLPFVPLMYGSRLSKIGDTYVGVMTRQYMHGTPLSHVWSMMSDGERRRVTADVRMASEAIGTHVSKRFMELQGRNLSTQDPVSYINYRILLSKLTRDLREEDISPLSMDDFRCAAVLSHQDLSLDHIIVDEGRLSGVVGWGRCDYVPEVFDRLKYYFAQPRRDGERQWYEFVSKMPFIYPPPPPLYSITCMYYHYNLRKNTTSSEYYRHLDAMLQTVAESLIEQSRDQSSHDCDEYSPEAGSDQRSRDSHDKGSADTDSIAEDPFSDSARYSFQYTQETDVAEEDEHELSTTPSSSQRTSWDCGDTITELIDSLSVA